MSLKEIAQAAILTERAAIQDEMKWIRDERRLLHNRYYELLDRLRVLDERDIEAIDPTIVINQLVETTNRLGNLIPAVSIQQVLDEVVKHIDKEQVIEKEPESIIPKQVIEQEKERVEKQSKMMRGSKNDYQKQLPLVADIMKELGRPVQLGELKDLMYEKHGIVWKNAGNALNAVMMYEPKIEKVAYGTYQYRM